MDLSGTVRRCRLASPRGFGMHISDPPPSYVQMLDIARLKQGMTGSGYVGRGAIKKMKCSVLVSLILVGAYEVSSDMTCS